MSKIEAEKSYEADVESVSSSSLEGDIYANAPAGKATDFQAYVNVVSVLAGAGTLGLPAALQSAGWVGLIILALACAMAIYSNQKLIKCLYYDGRNRLREYPDVAHAAFGLPGRIVVTFFYNSIALGGPVLYLILTGTNIYDLASSVGNTITVKQWIMIAAAIMVVPIILTKTMREVAFLSIFGALSTTIVVFIVMIAAIIDKGNFDTIALPDGTVGPVHHDIVVPRNLPLALATFAFSYGGNVIFPHVEESMKTKRSWNRIILWGTLTVTVLYFLCSTSGYAVYGSAVQSPIYLNLPGGATRTISTIIITLHVLLAIPLFMTTFNLQIEAALKLDQRGFSSKTEFFYRAILRTASMVLVATIALFFPYFGQMMSLLGALSDGMLTFVFPVVFYLKLYGIKSVGKFELLIMALIIIVGTAGSAIGTVDAVKELYKAYHHELD
ncbi:solute carrier family 32 (vesicular inhibitory amino acid transporter) [Entomortierella parvispora]|uniref:Solute carrier family 32 (Vesicular inhibitory amino acid transporter) n=1 Tax=Entomortierella parvispora TaxID=205924 RepID=A0A9P3HBW5_9FUNG|nr:solute carrier family 32 (vesicular inhibitory amino acid transporter) [Entomortierella parvispora]